MKLDTICSQLKLPEKALDYAALRLGINREKHITRSDLDRISSFLEVHGGYSKAGLEAIRYFFNIGDVLWDRVNEAKQTDNSEIKSIRISTSGFSYRVAGVKYFKATTNDGKRFTLEGKDDQCDEYRIGVYWLPYEANKVTHTNRRVYESLPDVNFFLTMELSGCRFTMTDQSVCHVAFDAGTSMYQTPTSSTRNVAENSVLTNNSDKKLKIRRLSIGGDDNNSYGYAYFGYERNRATVIGVRQSNQKWVYKAFIYHRDSHLPQNTTKALVHILDNVKYSSNNYWAEKFL
ncbi:hypothetical protein [Microbulbifer sp. ZKSA002]|uniref:hypothetical protein n=1 Tax=Microbulbifer sp. ZKSA002 TaxID=3243388 RepID=UPI00403A4D43